MTGGVRGDVRGDMKRDDTSEFGGSGGALSGDDVPAKRREPQHGAQSVVQELAARQRQLSAVYARLDWHAQSPVETPGEWALVQRAHGKKDIWLREVEAALTPAEPRQIKVEVARLLSAYPTIPDAQKAAFGALLAQDMLQLGSGHQVMREAFFDVRRNTHRLCSAQVLSRVDLYTGQLQLLRTMIVKLPVPRFDYLGGAAAREQERIAAHQARAGGGSKGEPGGTRPGAGQR